MEKTELEMKALLAKKINGITHAIGRLSATGHNDHGNYDFIGYEQMNAKLRTMLPEHQIALVPEISDIRESSFLSAKGTLMFRTVLKGSIEIIDTETGYSITKKFVGADQDNSKSCGQAVTELVKRAELKLFHVSTKADIDPDGQNNACFPQQTPQGSYQQQPQQQQKEAWM